MTKHEAFQLAASHYKQASHIAVTTDGHVYLCKDAEGLATVVEANKGEVFVVKGELPEEKKSKKSKE